MTPWQWFLLAVLGVAPVVVSALISRRKGRPVVGLVLGLILGWIGVIFVVIIPATRELRLLKRQQAGRR
jgi:hypothetical protein